MNDAHSSNWLRRTRQRWKVAVLGFAIGIACFLWASSYAISRQSYPLWLHLAGVVAMAGAFIWFGSSVRCRACGKSLAGWVITTVSLQAWFPSLVGLQKCPLCGDDGKR